MARTIRKITPRVAGTCRIGISHNVHYASKEVAGKFASKFWESEKVGASSLPAIQLRPATKLLPTIQLLPATKLPAIYQSPTLHPAPVYHLASARSPPPTRYRCTQDLFFFSRLIVLVEAARVEEVGSSEVGSSGKVSLLEKVVLVLLTVEAGAIKEGSRFLPSKVGSRSCYHDVCHQVGCHQDGVVEVDSGSCGFLKQVKGASTLLRVQILFMDVMTGRAATGARGSGFVGASRVR
jgi:hypothetical protein